MELFRASGFCLYARILGFKSNASSLLKAVKNNANIPVITKLADAKNKLDETGNKILSHELASSFLYRQAVWCKFHETLPDEFRAGIVIIYAVLFLFSFITAKIINKIKICLFITDICQ